MSPAGVLFATFAVLMLLGSPITVALGVAAMAALYTVDQNLVTLVQIAFTSVNSFPIMALPAFMLVGALMECAGISRRLVAIAENIVGPIPGGLAVSTALACVFFGAISGSGPATTAAVGMLMIPAMIRRGFSKGYAAAAAATAGGVGIIIPPSIPMVVYAVSGQQSITKMFLAGVMPGIMIAVGLAAMHLFLCRNMPVAEDLQSGSGDSLLKALKDGLWSLMAPVVILGGAKKVPERELLQEIRDALDAGASGVAMGRNIWGNEDPVRYAAAIAKLIHEDCSVDTALKEMNRLYGKRG